MAIYQHFNLFFPSFGYVGTPSAQSWHRASLRATPKTMEELIPQRFRCLLVPGDGVGGRLAVRVEIGARGVSLVREGTERELQVLPLASLARWDTLGTAPYVAGVALLIDGGALPGGHCSPVVGTRLSPGTGGLSDNVFEVVLESDSRTGREILDTIVTTCHQVHEVRERQALEQTQTQIAAGGIPGRPLGVERQGLYAHGTGARQMDVGQNSQVAEDEDLARAIAASWEEEDMKAALRTDHGRWGGLQNLVSSRGGMGTHVPREEWVPDEAMDECESCGAAFGIMRRKHHCRRCGHIFCDACCPKGHGSTGSRERVCAICSTGRLPVALATQLERAGQRAAEFAASRPDTSRDAELATRLQAEMNADAARGASGQPPTQIASNPTPQHYVEVHPGVAKPMRRHAQDSTGLALGPGTITYNSAEPVLTTDVATRAASSWQQHDLPPATWNFHPTKHGTVFVGNDQRAPPCASVSQIAGVTYPDIYGASPSAISQIPPTLSLSHPGDLLVTHPPSSFEETQRQASPPRPAVIKAPEFISGALPDLLGGLHDDMDPGLRDLQIGIANVEQYPENALPSAGKSPGTEAASVLVNALPSAPQQSPAVRRQNAIAAARARDAAAESSGAGILT